MDVENHSTSTNNDAVGHKIANRFADMLERVPNANLTPTRTNHFDESCYKHEQKLTSATECGKKIMLVWRMVLNDVLVVRVARYLANKMF